MRKRFGATPAESPWRDACGGAVRATLRKRNGEKTAEAL